MITINRLGDFGYFLAYADSILCNAFPVAVDHALVRNGLCDPASEKCIPVIYNVYVGHRDAGRPRCPVHRQIDLTSG